MSFNTRRSLKKLTSLKLSEIKDPVLLMDELVKVMEGSIRQTVTKQKSDNFLAKWKWKRK